ncbi:MAG: hypothetical protein CR986_01890 [Ignavibacteriae bacterium]|nr:MAG: hypothetical protein CR986_01890 [Ignavibacteriota bacterium]
MFSKEVKYISDLNLNKLKAIGKKITIEELKKSKVHPALVKYIASGLDKDIINDKKRIENDSIFNYRNDRIYEYFMLIGEEIKRTHNFDLDFLKTKLTEAINFNIEFLISPNKTLTNFIFDKIDSKSIEEILVDLSHLYYYNYLQKILLTYLDKKQVLTMKKTEFIYLLDKIDQISNNTHKEETIITAINSMADFFDPQAKNSRTVPIHAIKRYLEEKNLSEYIQKVDEKYSDDTNISVSKNEITSLIKSVIPITEITIEENKDVESDFIVDNGKEPENDTIELTEQELIDGGPANNSETLVPENKQEIRNDIENSPKLSDDKNDTNENNKNEIDEKNSKEALEEKNKKKKVIIDNLVNKHIDLPKLYDSLLPSLTPFKQKIEAEDIQKAISNRMADNQYLIDLSELEEEIEVEETKVADNNFAQFKQEEQKIFDDENSEVEIIDNLEYLSEIPEETAKEESFENNEIEEKKTLSSKENTNTKSNFSETVKYLNMSQIIAKLFDYDMEEYKNFLTEINETKNEDDALNHLNDFCERKNIEKDLSEVKKIKDIISEFFAKKIYS